MRSEKFQMFDYGPKKNKKLYFRTTPPKYNLSKVTIPVSIVRTVNDPLSAKQDIKTLTTKLKNVRTVIVLPGNHIDYIFDPTTITAIKDHMLIEMDDNNVDSGEK